MGGVIVDSPSWRKGILKLPGAPCGFGGLYGGVEMIWVILAGICKWLGGERVC